MPEGKGEGMQRAAAPAVVSTFPSGACRAECLPEFYHSVRSLRSNKICSSATFGYGLQFVTSAKRHTSVSALLEFLRMPSQRSLTSVLCIYCLWRKLLPLSLIMWFQGTANYSTPTLGHISQSEQKHVTLVKLIKTILQHISIGARRKGVHIGFLCCIADHYLVALDNTHL